VNAHLTKSTLTTQIRVINALILREVITRYGRENIGFLWLIVEPMLFTAGIATAWSFGHVAHGGLIPAIEFAITGYSSLLMWRNSLNRSVNGLQPNFDLLYHRPVTPLIILVSRTLLEFIGATCSFSTIVITLGLLGFIKLPYDLPGIILSWSLLAMISISLSIFIGALSELSELLERFWHVTTYLLFPFSGVIFMVDWLTPSLQKIVLLVPMVNATEMLRGAYFGPSVKTHYSISYMLVFSFTTLFLGLLTLKHAEKRLERK
jgi:capsular polysaccharide transport system permease protein